MTREELCTFGEQHAVRAAVTNEYNAVMDLWVAYWRCKEADSSTADAAACSMCNQSDQLHCLHIPSTHSPVHPSIIIISLTIT
jgi:hypothetical protein